MSGVQIKQGATLLGITLGLITLTIFPACERSQQGQKENMIQRLSIQSRTPSIERGRAIYQAHCIACHNPNPHKLGSVGPDVYGSSLELLEAKVLKSQYPQAYTPKRSTHLMAPLPHLKLEIQSIHAYLNSI